MKAVFLGATRGMGRALSRRMAARGDRLFLLGRDLEDLQRTGGDLEVYGRGAVAGSARCDLLDPGGFAEALDRADEALQGFDTVVLTAGVFATQEELESSSRRCRELLQVNLVSTLLFCEEARRRLIERGGGTLCAFSSVAGDRPRSPVVLYGATKAGLSYYLEGLDRRYRRQGLCTVCVKPGFVRTGMTADLQPPPFAGDPDAVARRVLRAIDRGQPVVYAPGVWRWVMMVVRRMPGFVLRRLEF